MGLFELEKRGKTPVTEGQSAGEVWGDISTGGKPTDEVKGLPKAPKPTAKGNKEISILRHKIYRKVGESGGEKPAGVEIAVKNISDSEIDTAVFEAVFYDIEGNILDTVEHKTTGLGPGCDRGIRIASSTTLPDRIESYIVKVLETKSPPKPVAIGNEKIEIFKHGISGLEKVEIKDFPNSVEFSIKNISGKTIATAIFEIIFLGIEGNTLEKTEKRITDLRPGICRAVNVDCHLMEYRIVKSYSIILRRVVTADMEKVQVRRHERKITETGEEGIAGTVKNISEVKTDAALVAQYYDFANEVISTMVLPLRDIEPNETRQFEFKYRPQEGDRVAKYNLTIADIVG